MFAKLTDCAGTSILGVVFLVLVAGAVPVRAAEEGEITTVAAAIEANPTLFATLKDYSSPLFIPAADFRTDGLYPEATFYSMAGYWQGDDLGGVYMMAPVWLPNGAEIATVFLFAVDNDDVCSSENISLWLQRVDNFDGSVDGMAVMSTSGSSTNMQTPFETDPSYPVIDYPGFSYWLTVRVCSTDHEFYGAMIIY